MPERVCLNVNLNPLDHLKRDAVENLLRFTGIEVTGYKNLELFQGPAIYNLFPHTSHLDSWTMRLALPLKQKHSLVFLAKKEYWDGWRRPFGELTNALILIPTAEGTFPLTAFKTAVACLSQGYSIGISAEGTRTFGPIDNRHFEDGIGLLLSMTDYKHPLVPVLLKGFGDVWPKGQNLPHWLEKSRVLFQRKQASVHFGSPKFYKKEDLAKREDLVESFRQHCISEYHKQFNDAE